MIIKWIIIKIFNLIHSFTHYVHQHMNATCQTCDLPGREAAAYMMRHEMCSSNSMLNSSIIVTPSN